jgi:hypothetical protein
MSKQFKKREREREKGRGDMGCMVKKTKDKQQLLHHQNK